jgi:hypothetical protein
LTFITPSADASKEYTRLVLDVGQIGLCVQGGNLIGQVGDLILSIHVNVVFQVWEEIRSGGIEMLNEPFHVVCSSGEKTFFEHTSAVVHVADDLLQKTRFFQNNRFSGSCMATLMTLGIAGRTPDDNDLFQQLLAAVKKVPHVQVIIAPPPPIQNDAYVRQAKQLMETFPELYGMTDTGGSLLQVCPAIATMKVHSRFQIGRYGTHADRRYVSGDKWDKDGILALKAHLVQVLGHHWLRNTPKASAAFPLRQLHQLQLDSSGKAVSQSAGRFSESVHRFVLQNGMNFKLGNPEKPLEGVFLRILAPLLCFRKWKLPSLLQPESQPSTSRRSYDANLHSTRGGRINRHVAASRSGPRSTNTIDPQLLTDIISALQPSSQPSKSHRHQKRQ